MKTFSPNSLLAAIAMAVRTVYGGLVSAGPMGQYFVTDESGVNNVLQFQGNTLMTFPTSPANVRQGPIVVDGNTDTIRAVAGGFIGGVQGALNLNFSLHSGYGGVVDAGFDGTNAYVVPRHPSRSWRPRRCRSAMD